MINKILSFFKIKKFQSSNKENNKVMKMKKSEKKRFDFEVFERDLQDDGRVISKPIGRQSMVASSAEEVIGLFKMCDQDVRIINVTDEIVPDVNQQTNENNKQNAQPTQQSLNDEISNIINPPSVDTPNPTTNMIDDDTQQPMMLNNRIPLSKKRPVEYYNIGDIEIKNDNGKIYQKQWIRLNETEARDIRIINTKTNKIINLEGKHIECKKWILVEKNEDDRQ